MNAKEGWQRQYIRKYRISSFRHVYIRFRDLLLVRSFFRVDLFGSQANHFHLTRLSHWLISYFWMIINFVSFRYHHSCSSTIKR